MPSRLGTSRETRRVDDPQIGGLISTRAGAGADALRFVCFGAGGRGASESPPLPSRPTCSHGALAPDCFGLKKAGTGLLGGGGGGDWSWDFEGLLVREDSPSSSELDEISSGAACVEPRSPPPEDVT